MKRLPRWLGLCVALAPVCSCAYVNMHDVAAREFSQASSCPIDRMTVKERVGVKVRDIVKRPDPPADVASDPDRLQVWRATQAKKYDFTDGMTVFDVEGCGQRKTMTCARWGKNPRGRCPDWLDLR